MPQSANISVQNNFSKGFITEATGLTFPENAATDTDNCIFNHLGVASRRFGFNFELNNAEQVQNLTDKAISTFLWTNVGGDGDETFAVVQIGDNLYFYGVSTNVSLSAGKHTSFINLASFTVPGITSLMGSECTYSSGNGRLFVANRRIDTIYIEYDVNADTFVATRITPMIRDFDGVADSLAVTERPVVGIGGLTTAHRYNLANQGWSDANLVSWDNVRTDMPSNADVSWYFKNSTDAFDFTTADNRAIGSSAAPRGHFIYSVYNINRSINASGLEDVKINLERFNQTAFFAGRVFYAGLKTPTHSSRIYFSQVVESPDQYGKCYQLNDPTSENLFDLLPTDGGVIDILEAGQIIKMLPMFNTLLIFCSNGVWSISGSQGQGFAANDYSISKISSIVNISDTSFVVVEGTPYWWNLEGIQTITSDKQTNAVRVNNVTDPTIRSFFLSIPAESKHNAKGAYDAFLKTIYWLYKSVNHTDTADKYVYDRVLVLNMITGAFYKWSVSTTNVRIKGLITVLGVRADAFAGDVFNSADAVLNGTDTVISFIAGERAATSVVKFFVTRNPTDNSRVSFAEANSEDYLDWLGFDGIGQSYDSYFVTGYVIRGKAMTKFQEGYVNIISTGTIHRTSYTIRGTWDYALSTDTNRWSTSQFFILNNEGYAYNTKRIKIRGHGKALQFKISNHDPYPFSIVGWSVYETGNTKP